MATDSIIEFRNISFAFSHKAPILTGVTLTIREGGFYLVQGPSGAGKSTFLRLINRLEEPLSGEILFKGRPLSSYAPPVLRRSVLYVQQTPTAIDASVRENLLLPFSFKNNTHLEQPVDEILKKRLDDFLLRDVGLGDNALTLSLGQLQRLCFIRGFLLSPDVLLLDEPTSALDRESGGVLESMVEQLNRESGLTVLTATHKEPNPGQVTPLILKMAEGRIREVKWNTES